MTLVMPATGMDRTQPDPTVLPIPDWLFWAIVIVMLVMAAKGFVDGIRQYRR